MNYRRNEDKIYYNEPSGACYNSIISMDEDFGSGTVSEPVSLAEVKSYLRLEGFTDESGASEFDYDDTLLESMITQARMWVEKFTAVLVIPRDLTVVLINEAGLIELPGPINGAIVVTSRDSVVQEVITIGTSFPKLETVFNDRVTLVYEAGYVDAPEWVKNAIKAYIAWAYEHRGDEDLPGSSLRAAVICRPYRRVTLWA